MQSSLTTVNSFILFLHNYELEQLRVTFTTTTIIMPNSLSLSNIHYIYIAKNLSSFLFQYYKARLRRLNESLVKTRMPLYEYKKTTSTSTSLKIDEVLTFLKRNKLGDKGIRKTNIGIQKDNVEKFTSHVTLAESRHFLEKPNHQLKRDMLSRKLSGHGSSGHNTKNYTGLHITKPIDLLDLSQMTKTDIFPQHVIQFNENESRKAIVGVDGNIIDPTHGVGDLGASIMMPYLSSKFSPIRIYESTETGIMKPYPNNIFSSAGNNGHGNETMIPYLKRDYSTYGKYGDQNRMEKSIFRFQENLPNTNRVRQKLASPINALHLNNGFLSNGINWNKNDPKSFMIEGSSAKNKSGNWKDFFGIQQDGENTNNGIQEFLSQHIFTNMNYSLKALPCASENQNRTDLYQLPRGSSRSNEEHNLGNSESQDGGTFMEDFEQYVKELITIVRSFLDADQA